MQRRVTQRQKNSQTHTFCIFPTGRGVLFWDYWGGGFFWLLVLVWFLVHLFKF